MSKKFFQESRKVRENLRKNIMEKTDVIPNKKIKEIVSQRHSTSSLLKGVISYFIHSGVGGSFSEDLKLELASGIEILCSGGAILDNVIDEHAERNGQTTYLNEYGKNMQLAASQYVFHQGLKILLPFMVGFAQNHAHRYTIDQAVIGMIGMDIEPSKNLEEQLEVIEKSNGIFNSVPFVIAATTGTKDEDKIINVEKYGHNLGCGLAVYEELRDLLGEHGRRRATEVEDGRLILPLHFASKKGFDLKEYSGKRLSKDEYWKLVNILVQSGAIKMSTDLARLYLNRSQTALLQGVDTVCYKKLDHLTTSILDSLGELEKKAFENFS